MRVHEPVNLIRRDIELADHGAFETPLSLGLASPLHRQRRLANLIRPAYMIIHGMTACPAHPEDPRMRIPARFNVIRLSLSDVVKGKFPLEHPFNHFFPAVLGWIGGGNGDRRTARENPPFSAKTGQALFPGRGW